VPFPASEERFACQAGTRAHDKGIWKNPTLNSKKNKLANPVLGLTLCRKLAKEDVVVGSPLLFGPTGPNKIVPPHRPAVCRRRREGISASRTAGAAPFHVAGDLARHRYRDAGEGGRHRNSIVPAVPRLHLFRHTCYARIRSALYTQV
jgi:hypothetical protein